MKYKDIEICLASMQNEAKLFSRREFLKTGAALSVGFFMFNMPLNTFIDHSKTIMRPKRNPHVAWKKDEDAVIIFSPAGAYTLNRTGSEIWELCDDKHTIIEISKIISDRFQVEEKACVGDLVKFMRNLENKGLIFLTTNPLELIFHILINSII